MLVKMVNIVNKINIVKKSPCGKRVIVSETGHKIRYIEISTFESLTEYWTLHNSTVTSMNFSNDGKYITSSGLDSKVI